MEFNGKGGEAVNNSYEVIVFLRGGQLMRIGIHDKEELVKLRSIIDDLIRRIFNAVNKDDSAPFVML